MRLATTMAAIVIACGVTARAADQQQPAVTVTGDSSPNRWATPNDSSATKPAKIGTADSRMQVPVANGDIIEFVVKSGSHHILFEHAVAEQAAGTWEIVASTGSLEKLPDGQFPHYDHDDARSSTAGTGSLLKIRILKLDKGRTILFGCRPHSESPTGNNVMMLGAIIGK